MDINFQAKSTVYPFQVLAHANTLEALHAKCAAMGKAQSTYEVQPVDMQKVMQQMIADLGRVTYTKR